MGDDRPPVAPPSDPAAAGMGSYHPPAQPAGAQPVPPARAAYSSWSAPDPRQPPPPLSPVPMPSLEQTATYPGVSIALAGGSPWSGAEAPRNDGPGWMGNAPAPAPAPVPVPVPVPDPIGDAARSRTDPFPPAMSAPAVQAPAPEPPPAEAPPLGTYALRLLWLDNAAVPRMRRKPPWAALLESLGEQSDDPFSDDGYHPDDALAADDQRDVSAIITSGSPSSIEQAQQQLLQSFTSSPRLLFPLVLMSGQLSCDYDTIVKLNATLCAAKPLAQHHRPLTDAVEAAESFLASAGDYPNESMAERRMADVLQSLPNMELRTSVEEHMRTTALEQRAFRRRKVFGAEYVRARLRTGHEESAELIVYLPPAAARQLPLFERLDVRLIGEICPRQEQHEPLPLALRVVALGWTLRFPA